MPVLSSKTATCTQEGHIPLCLLHAATLAIQQWIHVADVTGRGLEHRKRISVQKERVYLLQVVLQLRVLHLSYPAIIPELHCDYCHTVQLVDIVKLFMLSPRLGYQPLGTCVGKWGHITIH